MNCDTFREQVVTGTLSPSERQPHAASCPECAAWASTEMATMNKLSEAGAQWRAAPLGEAVVARIAGTRPTRAPRWGWAMRLAAAAAIVLAAGTGLVVALGPSPASAMGLMMRELHARGTVCFTLESPYGSPQSGRFMVRGTQMRIDLPSGEFLISSPASGEMALVRPASREVIRGSVQREAFDLYAMFLSLADAPHVESLGYATINGRNARVLRVELPPALDAVPDLIATVWFDTATRLPLRAELPSRSGTKTQTIVFRDFVFDQPLSDELFSTSPDGYTDSRPTATTPGIGMQIGIRVKNISMAFQLYMHDHGGESPGGLPQTLDDLRPYLKEGELINPRNPSEPIGFEYVSPTLPLDYTSVLIYERFAEGADQIWVGLVDGRSQVMTQAELARALGR